MAIRWILKPLAVSSCGRYLITHDSISVNVSRLGQGGFHMVGDFEEAKAVAETMQEDDQVTNLKNGDNYEFIGVGEDATNGTEGRPYAVYAKGGRLFVRQEGEFVQKFEIPSDVHALRGRKPKS